MLITIAEENKKLIKQFKVETKEKNKTLSIFYGDILEDDSDIIGISVYDNEKDKGDLYNAIWEKMRDAEGYRDERLFLKEDKIWTSLSVSEKNSRTILFIHCSDLEGDFITRENFRSMLKLAFATINSFTYEGHQGSSVALPVLFRKGIKKDDYTQYVQTFLYEASECLRKNSSVEELKIYIWHELEAQFWLEILNDRLTVSLDEELRGEKEKEIRNDIIKNLKQPLIQKLLPLWLIKKIEKDLGNADENIVFLSNYGNKVIDFISEDLLAILELSSHGVRMNPYQRVFAIKSTRSLVEWFGDYMYSIKVFKKYAENHSPSPLDKYYFLMQLSQVIFYYEQICTERGELDHGGK